MGAGRDPIDFLIIGAEKCGTTWLADMLRQHPAIFIPPEKELFYFNERFFESPELHNFNHDQPLAWYLGNFTEAAPGQLKGEASPAYLWDDRAPGRIHAFNPRARLIACLRDPVARAYSQYRYFIQRGTFGRISFEQALELRPDLRSRGLYDQQLARYDTLFPGEQLLILFFEDLVADSGLYLTRSQAHLSVPVMLPDNMDVRVNVTGEPRWALLNRMLARVRYPLRKHNPSWLIEVLRRSGMAALQERIRLANTRPASQETVVDPDTAARLRDFFLPDIEKLEQRTGRDLSAWKA